MKNTLIDEAIANLAYTSQVLETYSNNPKNYNSDGFQVLERMSWELHKQANELREFQYLYGA